MEKTSLGKNENLARELEERLKKHIPLIYVDGYSSNGDFGLYIGRGIIRFPLFVENGILKFKLRRKISKTLVVIQKLGDRFFIYNHNLHLRDIILEYFNEKKYDFEYHQLYH